MSSLPEHSTSLGLLLSIDPSAGAVGEGLDTGFSTGISLRFRRGALSPGGRLTYSRYSGSILNESSLHLINLDAGLRWHFLPIKKSSLFVEATLGAAASFARLPDTSASGLRFRFGIQLGINIPLGKTLTLSSGFALQGTIENGANLFSFPILLEISHTL